MGVVSRRRVWLVGEGESMGVVGLYGCGCNELYRFPHTILILHTIPTPLVSVLFCSSIPTFCSLKKKVFRSCSSTFV